MSVATAPFAGALRRAAGPGGHATAMLDDAFRGVGGPSGGLLAALVLAAAAERLAGTPRTLTLHYLRRAHAGDIEIRLEPLRQGRSTTVSRAELWQDGSAFATGIGAWASSRPARASWPLAAPAVPPPEDVPAALMPSPPVPPIFQHLELRPAIGPPPFTGAGEALTGGWLRLREPGDVSIPALAFLSDAWWPAVFGRTDSLHDVPTLELTLHFHGIPRPGDGPWVLARFEAPAASDGFVAEDGALWSRDGRLLARSRQLARL
jgi:acyl-CoA thioesterase